MTETQHDTTSSLDIKGLLFRDSSFLEHYEMQKGEHGELYKTTVLSLLDQNVELSPGTKSKILAAAWARHDIDFSDSLLHNAGMDKDSNNNSQKKKEESPFGLPEVLRALKLLDSRRELRALEKKLQRMEHENTAKPPTVGKIKWKINHLKTDDVQFGSVSGSLAKFIGKWVREIPPEKLQFYALSLPKEPWRELANICHLKPSNFSLPWFLDFVFDKPVQEQTIVSECSDLFYHDEDKIVHLLNKWKVPYSCVRRQLHQAPETSEPQYEPEQRSRVPTSRKGRTTGRPPRGRGGRGRGRGGRGRGRGGRGRAPAPSTPSNAQGRAPARRGGRGRGRPWAHRGQPAPQDITQGENATNTEEQKQDSQVKAEENSNNTENATPQLTEKQRKKLEAKKQIEQNKKDKQRKKNFKKLVSRIQKKKAEQEKKKQAAQEKLNAEKPSEEKPSEAQTANWAEDSQTTSWDQPTQQTASWGEPAEAATNNNANKTPSAEDSTKKVKQFTALTPRMKEAIASYELLDTVLWWYEELNCKEAEAVVKKRLQSGERPGFSYGTLMDRLLYCHKNKFSFFEDLIPIAEKRLAELDVPLEPPVVILADASGSMEVAIRTATIIGSLMTVLTKADLRFFSATNRGPPDNKMPSTIADVLYVTENVKAGGGTAPAASLYPSYENKEKVNFFVVVTDEEENQQYKEYNFCPLFKKYREEVNPDAKLVFISFLSGSNAKGQMVTELENNGVKPTHVFRLDVKKPDLTKLDTFLGLMSAESGLFKKK